MIPSLRLALAVLLAGGTLAPPSLPGQSPAVPDFTKGDAVPAGFTKDWNLGPTGARGWIHSDRLVTRDARQILITQVAGGSPAEGRLAPGDVILGVMGQAFQEDPRTEFGKAVTAAESLGGVLRVTRWRAGRQEEMTLPLAALGSYSDTAPYVCQKSARILQATCKALALRMQEESYPKSQNPITRSLNALGLLASGDKSYLPLVKREAAWAADFTARDFATWYNAYVIMLLAEYTMASGDASYRDGLRRLALESARGQSAVGSWGHKFALPSGNLSGYGMMNAPGVPLTISLVLARMAGVRDAELSQAIEKSAKLIRYYAGKGAVPYGDHPAWTQTHEDNGKCGMAAMLFHLLGETDRAEFFARMALASHGAERDTGHTGNFLNILWSLPAVALNGPTASGAWMGEFGAWYFDLARRWDGSFPHQGPPEPKNDSYPGWDATGGYLLAYALPRKAIFLTGKKPSAIPQLDLASSRSLLDDGRGWDNKERHAFYDALSTEDLLKRLASWSPTVRERAAIALSRRKKDLPLAEIAAMLDSPAREARYGACLALKRAGAAAGPAVPRLLAQLDHPDLWVRVQATEALAEIGGPAMTALPVLLERLAQGPTPEDPRGMEQRHLCGAVFGRMLRNSVDAVDKNLLRKAVAAGLRNEDGHARSITAGIYKRLSYEDIKPLLPAILDAVTTPAPSGEMFADGVRLAGLELLAAHHIAEGMQACADYLRDQNKWGSQKRTPQVLPFLLRYGAHAQSVVSHLEETAAMFDSGEPNFPRQLSTQKAADLRGAIAAIRESREKPELRTLR